MTRARSPGRGRKTSRRSFERLKGMPETYRKWPVLKSDQASADGIIGAQAGRAIGRVTVSP